MMNLSRILPISLFVLLTVQSHAQEKEDVIIKAMKDELNRSMNELQLPDFDKPFFIHYGVRALESHAIFASLGGLYQSSSNSFRGKSVRILVGGYEFNDESLDDDITSDPQANDIELPIDDDYYGIRRAFWATTDNVYRNAARHFARNQATLKDQKKPLEEIPHRRFAKSPPVTHLEPISKYDFDKAQWEAFSRKLSARFKGIKQINYSGVMLSFQQGNDYYVNSEGSVVRIPVSQVTLTVSIQGRTEAGQNFQEHILHYASTPDKLPSAETIDTEVKEILERVRGMETIPVWNEEYAGPVLMIGDGAGETLLATTLFGREGLLDNNSIPSLNGYRVDPESRMDAKIGKPLFAENLTVRALPFLKSFQGVELLGSFPVDNECVVPAKELVMIENGVLRNLLSDRTLTRDDQKPNGHGSGPGVVQFDYKGPESIETLKAKLIAEAKKEGLDYALIIRDKAVGRSGVSYVYKVSLEDGSETLYRMAQVESLTSRDVRKALGMSTEKNAFNIQAGSNIGMISVIAPEAILFEEVEIRESNTPIFKDQEYVESPIARN